MSGESNLGLYILGYLLIISGVAYGAHVAGLSATWITIGVVVMLGMGLTSAVTQTQRKAQPEE